MIYCTQCGFKVDEEFKYCPNCGSRLESQNNLKIEPRNENSTIIICKNCGEENGIDDLVCFSCDVPLSRKKTIRNSQQVSGLKKNLSDSNELKKSADIENEKTFGTKKIILISVTIISIFFIAIVYSDAFKSTDEINIDELSNQTINADVNPDNLVEINQLQAKVDENPDDFESLLHLAHLQQDARLSEKAIQNYKKYLVKYPGNADARVDMAICYYNLNDYNRAITEMETAIEYQPNHQIAYLNLGIVNLAAKNIEVSKEWFNKTIELDTNSEAGKRAQELLHSH